MPRPKSGKPAARGIELVALLSDTHAGSTVALMPPTFTTEEGQTIDANSLQKYYWQRWQETQEWIGHIAGRDPFALLLNGDVIEGNHHRTDQIISPRINDHVECARILLEPLAKRAAKIFITEGTECHTGNAEANLGKIFNAEKDPDSESGRRVFKRLTLDVCGVRMVARHHVTTTSRPWLESNGPGMEIASEQLSAVRNGEPMPRILTVGHRHVPAHVQTGNALCIVTPAWQGLTRHGNKVVPASRCACGAYVLDWRGVETGQLPRVHRRIYEAPHSTAVAI